MDYKNMELKDYKSLKFSERRELDQKAYAKYYENIPLDSPCCSFNGFYGSETHKKYLRMFLRKYKLEQINELSKKNSQQR